MLLLYILWDDRPIFMISGSNQQLQQQLEYTLLKPHCHSWWFSKIQSGREDTLEERYAIKFCFKLGKNATETYGMLQTAFRPSCMNWVSVSQRHKRFKEGRESVRDDERCGISTRTMHQSTTPSLSQTIWPRWTSRQFLTVPIVHILLPLTFGYSLSSEAVVMRHLRRWKRLWWRSLTRSHKRTSMEAFQKLLERYKCIACRRRLLRRGLEVHVCTINKSAHTKKVWKLISWSSYLNFIHDNFFF